MPKASASRPVYQGLIHRWPFLYELVDVLVSVQENSEHEMLLDAVVVDERYRVASIFFPSKGDVSPMSVRLCSTINCGPSSIVIAASFRLKYFQCGTTHATQPLSALTPNLRTFFLVCIFLGALYSLISVFPPIYRMSTSSELLSPVPSLPVA